MALRCIKHPSFISRNVITILRSFSSKNPATITHTGQTFEGGDYRAVRFVDKSKEVNAQFAINLINEIPSKPSKERVVACDGGGGALGHPKVYINLDQPGDHSCGYCGLRFHLEHHH